MVEHEQFNADNKVDTVFNSQKKKISINVVLAQSVLFLMAGYETTATALSFASYYLAMHHEYQEKLIDEVDKVLEKHVNFNFYKAKELNSKIFL
jgi:cytochrome P450